MNQDNNGNNQNMFFNNSVAANNTPNNVPNATPNNVPNATPTNVQNVAPTNVQNIAPTPVADATPVAPPPNLINVTAGGENYIQENVSTGVSNAPGVNQSAPVSGVGNTEYGKEPMINCPKCGQQMKMSARCCMHCGELNYQNQKNDSVIPSFDKGKELKRKEDKKAAKEAAKIKYVNGVPVKNENRAKRFKFFRIITNIILVILLIVGAINYKFILKTVSEFRAKIYLAQVDKMVEQVKEEVEGKECNFLNLNEPLIYSFYQSDDYFDTWVSFYTFDYFSGYIEIYKVNDEYQYVVTITDGKYGFKEQKYEDLNIKSVKKIGPLEELPSEYLPCN